VSSTINELPLAFRTKAYYVVPDTAFLATHPVTLFHRFGSVIVQEAKTLIILGWRIFFVTMIVTSVLVLTNLL